MNKTVKTEGECNEYIPNLSGIPGEGMASEKIREGHREWTNQIDKVKEEKSTDQSYWQRVGSCSYF